MSNVDVDEVELWLTSMRLLERVRLIRRVSLPSLNHGFPLVDDLRVEGRGVFDERAPLMDAHDVRHLQGVEQELGYGDNAISNKYDLIEEHTHRIQSSSASSMRPSGR